MKMRVEVKGIKELEKELDRVAQEMRDSLNMGTVDAAEATASTIRRHAPGKISEAVATKPLPRKSNYPEVTMVGVDFFKAPHSHLVEFGTGPRYHASGKYVGQMPADPFFRRSIDEARGTIKNTIRDRAKEPIDRRR